MIPPALLSLISPTAREMVSSHPVTDKEQYKPGKSGAVYSLWVYRGSAIAWSTPWVSISDIQSELALPLSSFPFKITRVRLVRRLKAGSSVSLYTYRAKSLDFAVVKGKVKISKLSLAGSIKELRSLTVRSISNLPLKQVSSPSRPAESKLVSFTWVDENDGGRNTGIQTYYTYQRGSTSVRTPGFKTMAKRALPDNPYSMSEVRVTDNSLVKWSKYTNLPYWEFSRKLYKNYLGTSGYGSNVPDIDSTYVRNRALSKLADKANVGVNNLAESVATVGQLNRMVVNNVLKIVRSVRSLGKGDLLGAADALWQTQRRRRQSRQPLSRTKSLADNWLELQYGWKPLLSDINFAVDAIARLKVVDMDVTTVRSSSTRREKVERPLSHSDGFFPEFVTGFMSVETSLTKSFGLRFVITDQQRSLMAQAGFLSPISLAWELLPFSFVADWFLPLGPYLESFNQWQGLAFKGGWETTFVRKTETFAADYHRIYHPGESDEIDYGAYGSFSRKTVTMSRNPLVGFPSQTFPTFKNPFSVTHSLNAIALLKSVFGK